MRNSLVWLLERSKDGMVLSPERCCTIITTKCGQSQIYDPCGLITSDCLSFFWDQSILRLSTCSTRDQNYEKSLVWLLERSKDGMVLPLEKCHATCGQSQIYDPCDCISSNLMSLIRDRCVNFVIVHM